MKRVVSFAPNSLQRRMAQVGSSVAACAYKVVLAAAGALLVGMAVVLFAQVVCRYVLFVPLPWSEELARYMLVWFGMLSATAAAHTGQHFAIHVAQDLLPQPMRAWVKAAVHLATSAMSLYLAVLSYGYLGNIQGLRAVATGLPMPVVYAALPVSLLVMALLQAAAFLRAVGIEPGGSEMRQLPTLDTTPSEGGSLS